MLAGDFPMIYPVFSTYKFKFRTEETIIDIFYIQGASAKNLILRILPVKKR